MWHFFSRHPPSIFPALLASSAKRRGEAPNLGNGNFKSVSFPHRARVAGNVVVDGVDRARAGDLPGRRDRPVTRRSRMLLLAVQPQTLRMAHNSHLMFTASSSRPWSQFARPESRRVTSRVIYHPQAFFASCTMHGPSSTIPRVRTGKTSPGAPSSLFHIIRGAIFAAKRAARGFSSNSRQPRRRSRRTCGKFATVANLLRNAGARQDSGRYGA